MTAEKYEFSSQAWVDCAHDILVEAAGDTDLSDIEAVSYTHLTLQTILVL